MGDTSDLAHQQNTRNDPSMRRSDSGRGNPYELQESELAIDHVVRDAAPITDLDADAAEVVSTPPLASTPEAMEDTTGDEDMSSGVGEASGAAELLGTFNDENESDISSRPAVASGHFPIANYKDLTVPQIVEKAAGMSAAAMQQVLYYERTHRRRKTLIVKLERLSRAAK